MTAPPDHAPSSVTSGAYSGGGLAHPHGVCGPVLFARYAYPPNALGYCGPDDPAALLAMASQEADIAELAHRATQFDGAWPYLQLIADCNGIAEPLDPRVVEAYWTGNELLMSVPTGALVASLDDRFHRRVGTNATSLATTATNGVAQHNFHVFAVYPWLGMLRAGMEGAPLEVLDRCRIRWGRVETVVDDRVILHSRHLLFEGSKLVLGAEAVEEARCSMGGMTFISDLGEGDVVSLHWDWVCDRLPPGRLRWLQFCTARNLDAVNRLAPPPPAVVCGA